MFLCPIKHVLRRQVLDLLDEALHDTPSMPKATITCGMMIRRLKVMFNVIVCRGSSIVRRLNLILSWYVV
jgi:hypothetical protein